MKGQMGAACHRTLYCYTRRYKPLITLSQGVASEKSTENLFSHRSEVTFAQRHLTLTPNIAESPTPLSLLYRVVSMMCQDCITALIQSAVYARGSVIHSYIHSHKHNHGFGHSIANAMQRTH